MINKNFLLISILILVIVYILLQLHYEQQVNVFVINLDRSYMRNLSITAQLYLHGIEFNRFSAIDGRKYTFSEKEKELRELINKLNDRSNDSSLKDEIIFGLK